MYVCSVSTVRHSKDLLLTVHHSVRQCEKQAASCMRYGRQNVLLGHCPADAFAFTHGKPAEPRKWEAADASALHLQADSKT